MIAAYIAQGWALCPIPAGCKGPTGPRWNQPDQVLKNAADAEGQNVGLLHTLSGTCALDVDDLPLARLWLTERNINLDTLLQAADAVEIRSGRLGSAKLLYAMPLGLTIPTRRVTGERDGVRKVILEFRCASANGSSMQDVLPPSTHPSGTKYAWAGAGDWRMLPTLPAELFELWNSLIDADSQREVSVEGITPSSLAEVRSALLSIDPGCMRNVWIECGMALHAVADSLNEHDQLFALFDDWSAGSPSKYKKQDTINQWRSFKVRPDGITVASLFHHAFASGWKRPLPDVSKMFKPVKDEFPYEDVRNILSERPVLPDCDLSLWPEQLLSRSLEVSKEVGCDPIVPLLAGLSAVSGALDKRSHLQITSTWHVPPTVWLMTIGEPADKKTPGSKPMFAPLRQLEIEDRKRYEIEMLAWKGLEARYAAQMKSYREFMGSMESELPNNAPPGVTPLPEQPQQLRLIIADSTTQKLVNMAAGRPRGFLFWLDEMNKWLQRLADRSSTDDRGCWIQAYETGAYTMDRVGAGTIQADNLAMSIYGNCQPEVFRRNLSDASSDGLIQRFMPVMLDSQKNEMWQHNLPEFMSSSADYDQLIRRTYALPESQFVLGEGAMELFRRFCQWALETRTLERMTHKSDAYHTALGKIEGNCARLILLFHVIADPYSTVVTENTAWRAIELMQKFFYPSMKYVLLELASQRSKVGEIVFDYVIHHASLKPTVTMFELRKACRPAVAKDEFDRAFNEEIRVAMDELIEFGYAWVHQEHPRNPVFAINSSVAILFAEKRKKIILSRQEKIEQLRNTVKERRGTEANIGNAPGYDQLFGNQESA
jgi:hypothetical protein